MRTSLKITLWKFISETFRLVAVLSNFTKGSKIVLSMLLCMEVQEKRN